MKRIIAWAVSWSLFWVGHLVSKMFERHSFFGGLYAIYSKLMRWSVRIQDWGGAGPWDPA